MANTFSGIVVGLAQPSMVNQNLHLMILLSRQNGLYWIFSAFSLE